MIYSMSAEIPKFGDSVGYVCPALVNNVVVAEKCSEVTT